MNLIEDFIQQLFSHLTRSDLKFKGGIIKIHSENFDSHGEFSFPLEIKPWKHYIQHKDVEISNYNSILEYTFSNDDFDSDLERSIRLIDESKPWTLKIEKCLISNKRLYIFLDRIYTIKHYLYNQHNLAEDLSFIENNGPIVRLSSDELIDEDLTSCRLKHFIEVSRNLLRYSGFSVVNNEQNESASQRLHFTSRSACKNSEGNLSLFCGPVLNDTTKSKESGVSSSEYFSKRVMDMQLIAQHKYGLRIKNENQWKIFLEQIGQAAVIFDLLQNKPCQPVSINLADAVSGCSKGVSFILYNCARLSAILRKFKEHQTSGLYPELSSVKNVDMSLLNDSDEWILLFNFMLGYSSMLKKCVNLSSRNCPISPHLLCSYLSALAGRFSMYYRRIRILLEPRKHLVPLVEARIHFLIALQKILHHGLGVLNIVPVTQM